MSQKNKNRKYFFEDLQNEYKEIGSIKELSKIHGCTSGAIRYNLKAMGVNTSRGFKNWDKVVIDYKNGLMIKDLSEKHKLSKNRISAKLRELGIKQTHDNKPLNMPLGLGRHGERLVLSILDGAIDRNVDNCNARGYDIMFNKAKIDVKTSSLKISKNTGKNGSWGFETQSTNCDYYILVGLDHKKRTEKIFLIPFDEIKQKTVTISAGISKWDIFFVKETDLKRKIKEVQ